MNHFVNHNPEYAPHLEADQTSDWSSSHGRAMIASRFVSTA
jgi:hypothetical protein